MSEAVHESGDLRCNSDRFGCPHRWHETLSTSSSTLRLSWRCRKQPPDLQQTGLGKSMCLCVAAAGSVRIESKLLRLLLVLGLCSTVMSDSFRLGTVSCVTLGRCWLQLGCCICCCCLCSLSTRFGSSRPGARLSATRWRGRTLFAKHLPCRTPTNLTKGSQQHDSSS